MHKIFNIVIYIFAGIGAILILVYVSVQLGLTKTSGIIDTQHDYFKNQITKSQQRPEWTQTEEWNVLKEAIIRDKQVIILAGEKIAINPRLIVAILIVEQLRLFHSNREIFKTIFAPLKILGNQSQFSWGVMGIKQDTARQIENNLKDPNSPWYLGKENEHLLDYPATSTENQINSERFTRLTNENDRYYSYLYAAIAIKQIVTQWENSGITISGKSDIIATLFNIGFINSKPNKDPQSGGSEIEIGSQTLSFGSLARSFYESEEFIKEFPR